MPGKSGWPLPAIATVGRGRNCRPAADPGIRFCFEAVDGSPCRFSFHRRGAPPRKPERFRSKPTLGLPGKSDGYFEASWEPI